MMDSDSDLWSQGIVRTTYRDLPSESDYSYSPNDEGEGVDAYIVDT